MRKVKSLLTADRLGWRDRALGVLRPGVEAMLLAGVALGCSQALWSAVAPPAATADAPSPPPTGAMSVAIVETPFAPTGADLSAGASGAAAASIGLAGVRLFEDRAESGAVLTVEGGQQRAFRVGQDVVPGVRLAEVRADGVVLAFAGGERVVSLAPLSAGPLMAIAAAPAPAVGAEPATPFAVASPAPAAASPLSQDAWLLGALAAVERRDGAPVGWRVTGPLPDFAAGAGLAPGDLILSVNGVTPGAALPSAMPDRLDLVVERDAGARVTVAITAPTRS